MSLRLQRASRAPELQASSPRRRHTYIAPPTAFHTSTSLHRHRASRAPYLHASPSLHLQIASTPPDLHTHMLPRLHACSAPPSYPAVQLFFFALTLLCPYFIFTYPRQEREPVLKGPEQMNEGFPLKRGFSVRECNYALMDLRGDRIGS